MIHIFRKIRKKLADDNRPIQYMRYAIGEIVLVVIGILIALQINNWNEERKMKNVTERYIKRLIADIELDTLSIHEALKVRQRSSNNIISYFDFFHASSASLETLIDTALTVGFELRRYIPVNFTFTDMQTTGNLDLLSQEQQQALLELAHMQKTAQLVAEVRMDEYYIENSERNKYMSARPNLYPIDYYRKFGFQKDPKFMVQGLIHTNNMLMILKDYHEYQSILGKEIIIASKETIEILKNEK